MPENRSSHNREYPTDQAGALRLDELLLHYRNIVTTSPERIKPAEAMILGPHPGNGMFSISNYFRFCRDHLQTEMPEICFRAATPGNVDHFHREVQQESGRLTAWRENYLTWPLTLRRMRADLFHMIDQGLAWYGGYLNGGKRLVTVHDLIGYLNFTGKLPFERVSGFRAMILKRCIGEIRRADFIVSVSEHTADCLVRELSIPASRIAVVPNYLSSSFYRLPEEERAVARQKFFGNREHVVLHVGKSFVYKNRLGAIQAFAQVQERLPGAAMFLTSDPATQEEKAFLEQSGCGPSVHFLGALAQSDLRAVYNAADVLLFPSRYEGFGWPPLEAMACGCPVVATSRASLAEVIGDAGLTVPDPEDHSGLGHHVLSILTNPALARDLRERGFARAKRFSPQAMVSRMGEVYRTLLNA